MKNTITTFALVLIAFVAVNLLMSFARPLAADEPKQYMVVQVRVTESGQKAEFEHAVNQKLAEGWHIQGGISSLDRTMCQAMTK